MTIEEASRLIEDPLYLGVLMIKNGDADGEVSGADHSTGDVLRPAFHYVKTAPGISVVSGAFIMILPDKTFGENGVIIFADGAVHPNPNDKELAEIAIASAHTARAIAGFEPRIAMLSFSTKGSAKMKWSIRWLVRQKLRKKWRLICKLMGNFRPMQR